MNLLIIELSLRCETKFRFYSDAGTVDEKKENLTHAHRDFHHFFSNHITYNIQNFVFLVSTATDRIAIHAVCYENRFSLCQMHENVNF